MYSRLWPGEDDSFPGGQWPTGQVSKVDTTDVAKHRLSVGTPPPDMWRPCCPQDWAGLELGQMNGVGNPWTRHLHICGYQLCPQDCGQVRASGRLSYRRGFQKKNIVQKDRFLKKLLYLDCRYVSVTATINLVR